MASVDRSTIMRALDWAWTKAAKGLPGQESAEQLARRHMRPDRPLHQQLDALVRSHRRLAAGTGFCTNLGGAALLPATLPANLASTLFVQLRMVQAMAIVCGHELSDPRVRALCGLCLCGSKAAEIGAQCGARLGEALVEHLLTGMSAETIARLNTLVGIRLLARLGETGMLGTSRLVPLLGGLAGAVCDATITTAIGKAAVATFAPPAQQPDAAP